MVLSAANQTTFFTANDRCNLSAAARQLLVEEGIGTIESLSIGTKDFWDNFFAEMQKPKLVLIAPAVPAQGGNPGQAAQYQSQPRPRITAYSQDRLRRASLAVQYYNLVERPLTLTLVTTSMIDIIYEHVRKLKNSATNDTDHIVPVMGSGSSIQKYLQAFHQFLKTKVGSMDIPIKLAWVIRKEVNVPAPGTLQTNRPWSQEHGSFDAELIARARHTLIGYDMDNQHVYQYLCDGLRNTKYQATLDIYEESQDGRGAYFALLDQHMGKSAWRRMVLDANDYFTKATWNGSSSSNPFDNYANKHRMHYNNIVNAAKHVQATIPDEHTRVTNLLTGCVSNDTEFCTKKSAIQDTEDDPQGPYYNFELAVQRLSPACPVARHRGKRKHANISDVTAGKTIDETLSGQPQVELTSGTGKTGVRLGWHNKEAYSKLTQEQKSELNAWIKQHPEERPKKQEKSTERKQKRRKKQQEKKKESQNQEQRRMIMSVLADLIKEKKEADVSAAEAETPVTDNTSNKPVTLNDLLTRIS